MDIKEFLGGKDERPLDRLIEGGGFVSAFPNIAVIGDSLSSGELQINRPNGEQLFFDFYEYSWGHFIEKQTGSKVQIFAKGGMTAKTYRDSFANLRGYWKREHAANAYIIALGVNDLLNENAPVGSKDDVELEDYRNNGDSFIGNYAYIIQRYKEIQPEAKFFLLTIPRSSDSGDARKEKTEKMREAIYTLAKMFDNTYVVDLYEYAPDFNAEFKENFFLYGHMSPMGYRFISMLVVSYIDFIMRHNIEDFRNMGLMGVDQ